MGLLGRRSMGFEYKDIWNLLEYNGGYIGFRVRLLRFLGMYFWVVLVFMCFQGFEVYCLRYSWEDFLILMCFCIIHPIQYIPHRFGARQSDRLQLTLFGSNSGSHAPTSQYELYLSAVALSELLRPMLLSAWI